MTREEAIQWIQLDIDMARFDPTTGEDAYLNDDAKNVIEAQEMAISALKAQIDKDTNVPNNDCISRQEVIRLILERGLCCDTQEDREVSADIIRQLPSAQPERTCVNCGRTVNNGGWYADGRTRCPIEEHYALPKDGYCHLWEKRNVTDDDYPERREE